MVRFISVNPSPVFDARGSHPHATHHESRERHQSPPPAKADSIPRDLASLVGTDVRRLVACTQGASKETYAGTSGETEQGRAFLKKQLDLLMKEKAQYKEKKLALLQLQEELPGLQEGNEGGKL